MDLTLLLIGLVGGAITGLSPCILPVLPVIFLSGSGHRRPYLVVAGLVASFSLLTLAGAAVLAALPVPSGTIRWAGLVALLLLGFGLMVPRFGEFLQAPFTRIPQRNVNPDRGGFLLGLVLGTVYVPCAGPVLAAITVAGASGTIGFGTIELTAGFASGTAVTLLVFALAGKAIGSRVKAFRRRQRHIRIVSGIVVVALAVGLAFDAVGAVQRAVPDYTAALSHEFQRLVSTEPSIRSQASPQLAVCVQQALYGAVGSGDCGPAPAFADVTQWLNTPAHQPVDLASLRGRVVLVDFWTFDCVNCQNVIPHVNDWYRKYRAAGFEVVGVHTPEYGFEHEISGVVNAITRFGINYPVAVDNGYVNWSKYGVEAWPTTYLIDSAGDIRHITIGEGGYDKTEGLIRSLLPKLANP
ncbi:cytochrome c biogenesis protein/redoxin [Actinoplanes sp. NPDC051343]|uniref:cytochrome c biogenesis protein/redoxin n=1 Tax=Actinoplanes sp. NPDC051343 TaxID=3363906 RepID=UPI0037B56557